MQVSNPELAQVMIQMNPGKPSPLPVIHSPEYRMIPAKWLFVGGILSGSLNELFFLNIK